MEFQVIKSVPGSTEPKDIFKPHMPEVFLLSDMDAFFTDVRNILETRKGIENLMPGQRRIAIITPKRETLFFNAPPPRSASRFWDIYSLSPIRS